MVEIVVHQFVPKTSAKKLLKSKRHQSQNNPLENNVKRVPAKSSTLFSGGLFWLEAAQIWRELFHIIFLQIVLEAAQIWREPQQKNRHNHKTVPAQNRLELAPHYFWRIVLEAAQILRKQLQKK
jgi:hypothetical protein